MSELLAELVKLSDKISVVETRDDGERAPSFALNSPGHDISLRFAGIPMGHEFTSLVLALLQVGGHPPRTEQAIIDQIKDLDGDFSVRDLFLADLPELP
jgi:alkyl hydroperoxide reductase subunit F